MKMKGTNYKKQEGITLIALVVTIIVLLILAGISVSMIAGENGILYRAGEASEATRGGEVKEAVSLAIAENLMTKYAGGSKIGRDELIQEVDRLTLRENKIMLCVKGEYNITLAGSKT